MLDHIIITVSDFERSRSFYLAALEPLGYEVVMEFGKAIGLGVGGKPNFFIYGAFVLDPDGHNIEAGCHLAE